MNSAPTPDGLPRADEPTETGHAPDELDDVTDDGSRGDGTLADGETRDAVDDLEDNRASGGWSARSDEEALLTEDSDGEHDGDEHLPAELGGDAMGRPLDGSMNDGDQGMENAGENLGA